jgi:hypothetical protein
MGQRKGQRNDPRKGLAPIRITLIIASVLWAVGMMLACAGGPANHSGSGDKTSSEAALWRGLSDSGMTGADALFSRRDSLFYATATGEPRFAALRDSCRKALLAEGPDLTPYLLALTLSNPTPRQRHTIQSLLTELSDSGRVPEVAAHMAKALPKANDTIKVHILYFGSKLGDSSFRQAAWPYLAHDSLNVRLMVLRNLGEYLHSQNPGILLARIEGAGPEERQLRLWALSKQEAPFPPALVFPWLRDSLLAVRQSAADALVKGTRGKFLPLAAAADSALKSGKGWEYCRLALRLQGGDDYLKACDSTLQGEQALLWADLRKASVTHDRMGAKKDSP